MVTKRRKPSVKIAAPLNEPTVPSSRPGYAPLLSAGFQETASRVQEMHEAIAGKTFDGLLQVPGLSVPTRIVQGVHDAITQGVYAAVRHGGAAALSLAGSAEKLATDPTRVPGQKEQALRSALNAAFGDSLDAGGSAMAAKMSLHAHGRPLAVGPTSLATLRPRVCVFIHGLACDEQSWALRSAAWGESKWARALPDTSAIQYGALLEQEFGVSAIYLRYNTGLSIDANAQQLAALLARAALAAPQVKEWLLIGHSMGGLVARRAHELAAADGLPWALRVPMIVCLGSPHQGAPLEKLGDAVAGALSLSKVTQPLARIANARSQGIKDLRRGLKRTATLPSQPALRLVFATLGDGPDSIIGKMFGDGLVMAGSASDAGLPGDVQRVELSGLGHMALLNHPRVYEVLRRWLGTSDIA